MAEIDAGAVPAIDGALDLLADEAAVSGGSRRNAEYAAEFASYANGIHPARRRLLTDAMTSGGLLAAVPPERAGDVEAVRRAFAVGFDRATPDVERPHGSSDRQGPRS